MRSTPRLPPRAPRNGPRASNWPADGSTSGFAPTLEPPNLPTIHLFQRAWAHSGESAQLRETRMSSESSTPADGISQPGRNAMRNHPVQDSRTQTDERKFARRRVPLSAKMTDVAGKLVIVCTIQDMSLVGAQLSLPTAEPIPETVYLVDVTNRAAYKANVVWWRPHSVGLAFQETLELDEHLPSQPEFLKRVWMEAKLEEVDTLMANGRSLVEAVQM